MSPPFRCYCLIFLLALPYHLAVSSDCEPWMAKVISSQGKVESQGPDDYEWHSVANDAAFCYGDKVRTGNNSRASLMLKNGSILTLDQKTTFILLKPEQDNSNWLLEMLRGSIFFRSRFPQNLNIRTPFINAVHKGTEFLVTVGEREARISVFDGVVEGENDAGNITIAKGYSGIATNQGAPRVQALTVRPEDAVQWALYYPSVIDYRDWKTSEGSPLQPVLKAYRQDDLEQAFNALNDIPDNARDDRYRVLEASLLLSVGRAAEALAVTNAVSEQQPEFGSALALRSVIAVAKNRQQAALALAEQAIGLDRSSAAGYLALSYARQALLEVDKALQAAQEAVLLSPENALAWARLSELYLSTGDFDRAIEAADKAALLDPALARIQTVLGFAELAQIDLDSAGNSFQRAVSLDAGDPTARLGLGLVKIRRGRVEEGARDLELAVSLDPNNAVARSYLGKAYYELRNSGYAETELAIAKEMDPKDPTPWFYDAILKQSVNRPIEALHDMEQAIALNDNRGVYRSRLMLDEDAAARTANLARIYNDLGFGRVALKQAWKSLGYDSTNHSAHRFLADAYQGQPRFRIARASELLQAQLLQPINITPVQPQLTAENIGILNSLGPSSLSANEYDPMFTSNGLHVVLNGAYGSNNTLTDNAIVSGVYDNLSLSLGQFHYQTDGFRINDDYQQDIYDAFAQYSFNQDLSIQVEFKSEDVRAGDVPFRLNGFHQENLRQSIEHDTARVGGHYRIDSEQDLLMSTFYSTRKDRTESSTTAPFNGIPGFTIQRPTEIERNISGWQTELQYKFHTSIHDITAGFGYLNLKEDLSSNLQLKILAPNGNVLFQSELPASVDIRETNYFNGYLYTSQNYSSFFSTILGASFDNYNVSELNLSRLNPKFGIILKPAKDLILRGSALRVLKRPLAAGQTIEPTQVAGFNQFSDGTNGSLTWQYSSGLDYVLFDRFFMGGELNWRKIKNYSFITNDSSFNLTQEKRTGASHLAYMYWTPIDWLALRAEYRYDKLSREYKTNQADNSFPQSVKTDEVPLSISFFHESGFFSTFTGTFVNQNVAWVRNLQGLPAHSDPLERMNENFWTFDGSVGYRLPKRLGNINFEVRNMFNNKFRYQSNFDASGPQLSPFVPQREFFVKLSVFF